MGKVMKTTVVNEQNVSRDWYVIDAEGQTMGRIATRSYRSSWKAQAYFFSTYDGGDYVVVINAEKVQFTGKKIDTKMYHQYSGYAGGLRSQTARELLATYPERVFESATKECYLRTDWPDKLSKLKVYIGSEHPHSGQNLQAFPSHV